MAEAIKTNKQQSRSENSYEIFLEKLNGLKKEAYSFLDQALNLDNSKQINEAVIIYRKSYILMSKAINFIKNENINLVKYVEVNKVYQDLNIMLKKTLDRLELLEKDVHKKPANKVEKNNNKNNIDEYLLIGDEILNDDNHNKADSSIIEISSDEANATEIYKIESGVQLFYIAPDGSVSTPSYPTSLSVYLFNDPQKTLAKGFIRVGNWMYPLDPERTTAMKTNYNAFIFPNNSGEEEKESKDKINCKFVGVMFNEAVNGEIRNTFEDVLNNFAIIIEQQHQQQLQARQSQITSSTDQKMKQEDVIIIDDDDDEEKKKEGTAEYLSRNLVSGAKFINRGVTATTEFTNKYLNIGGEKLKTQIKPNETVSKVDPTLAKCTEGVRYGTNLTVKVSGFLVDKLGLLATKTAKTVAPYLKSGTTKLLTQTGIIKNSNEANQYLENVCTVASSSVLGFSIVYESLENAAKALAKTLAENSVEVVKHKYGDEMGKVTENTLYSAGNIAVATNNVRNLKITKTIAKAAVKETVNSFATTTKNEDKNKKI